jgi:TrmH family RNA methyltransferase
MIEITSRDNPLLKQIRKQIQDPAGYRKSGQVWVEGEHLCSAALLRGSVPEALVVKRSAWSRQTPPGADMARKCLVVEDALFDELSALESPADYGFLLSWPGLLQADVHTPTVVLDRLQDPGNVGAILRSASAFGFKQVLAIKGTVALWSPKVLRASMGAHFGLRLVEGADLAAVQSLRLPILTTDVHEGPYLHELIGHQQLPAACAWIMGHEGQGVSPELAALAGQKVRIAQPGGEESLNVATAAAICLHASATAGQS